MAISIVSIIYFSTTSYSTIKCSVCLVHRRFVFFPSLLHHFSSHSYSVCVCFFVQLCVGNVEMQAITGAKLRAILHYFSGVCVFRTANDVKWHAAHFSPKHYVDWNDRDTHSLTHIYP